MTWLLLGLLAGVIATSVCAFRWQRETYESIITLLERQRDEARTEAKVFRGLLFPVLNRQPDSSGAGSSPAAPSSSGGGLARSSKVEPSRGSQSPAPSSDPTQFFENLLRSRRIPFRQKFNLARMATNSKQKKTDTLAAALSQQKPSGENKNVAS